MQPDKIRLDLLLDVREPSVDKIICYPNTCEYNYLTLYTGLLQRAAHSLYSHFNKKWLDGCTRLNKNFFEIYRGPKVSVQTLGIITGSCFMSGTCNFVYDILRLLIRGFNHQK
jgi:hypothetical protein